MFVIGGYRWARDRPHSMGEGKKKLIMAALQKAPQCYDIVRVCPFCAQFLNDQDAYRVSI